MVLENLAVQHKAFGHGIVVQAQGKYITVKFENTEKTFVYPDIFEKFLTLEDGTVSEEILSDLNVSKNYKQAIIDKKNEENRRAMEHGIVIPGKENTIDGEDEESSKNAESEEI
jgi:hypothetical protein